MTSWQNCLSERWRSVSPIWGLNWLRTLSIFSNLTASFFKKLDAIILPFVWGYSKSHRISKAHLHKPSIKGGLGLPVFKHYYWAASSRALADWKCGGAKVDENPLWVQLEAAAVKMSSLPARPLYDSTSVAKSVRRIYTLKNWLRILNKIIVTFQVPSVSRYAPICENHSFCLHSWMGCSQSGERKVLELFSDLYSNNRFPSFAQLSTEFSLPNSTFFATSRSYTMSGKISTPPPPPILFLRSSCSLRTPGSLHQNMWALSPTELPLTLLGRPRPGT